MSKEIEKLERAVIDAALALYEAGVRVGNDTVDRAEHLQRSVVALRESEYMLPTSGWLRTRTSLNKDLAEGDEAREALHHWLDCMRMLQRHRSEKVYTKDCAGEAIDEFIEELGQRLSAEGK